MLTDLFAHTHKQLSQLYGPLPYDHGLSLKYAPEARIDNYYFRQMACRSGAADDHCSGFSRDRLQQPPCSAGRTEYLKRYNLPRALIIHRQLLRHSWISSRGDWAGMRRCGLPVQGQLVRRARDWKHTHSKKPLSPSSWPRLACEQHWKSWQSRGSDNHFHTVDFWGPHSLISRRRNSRSVSEGDFCSWCGSYRNRLPENRSLLPERSSPFGKR